MNTRVYLSQNDFSLTHQEDTPMRIRIPLSRATVKDLYSRLQQAYPFVVAIDGLSRQRHVRLARARKEFSVTLKNKEGI